MIADLSKAFEFGTEYTVTLDVSDPDGDSITLLLLEKPGGMTLEGTVIQWKPEYGNVGIHTVKVVADDGRLAYDTLQWTVTVQPNNFFTDITYNPLITGAVPFNTEVYRFHFQGTADDAVNMLLKLESYTGTTIRFTDPSDEVFSVTDAKALNGYQIRNPKPLWTTGTYTMTITRDSHWKEHPFSFVLYSRAKMFAESPVVQFGTRFYDTIATGLEMSSYRMEATGGDQLCLTAYTGERHEIEIGLVDEAHTAVKLNTLFKRMAISYHDTIGIPSTGSYLLIARSIDTAGAGEISLAVNSRMAQRGGGPELVYGTPHSDSILNPVQINSYTFNGTQNDSITLFAQCDSGLSALVTLYDPSFLIVLPEKRFTATGSNSTLVLPATGTYLVQIRTESSVMPVPYQVRVSDES